MLDALAEALLPSDAPDWRATVAARALARLEAQPAMRGELARLQMFLRLLDSPMGALLVSGQRRPFSSLGPAEREQVLRRMFSHRVGTVRGAALSVKRLVGAIYYADSDHTGTNPTWPSLGYPGPIGPHAAPAERLPLLEVRGPTTLECDVVVVGSGAGGGIVAAELATAGRDVLVLERGPYLADSDFDQREIDTFGRAYLDGGLRSTQDLGLLVIAGACLGGGTVVNYTTSFRTPDDVRDEWSQVSGLELFRSAQFSTALDAACEQLGVNQAHNEPSARDALMERGLRANGWHVDRMPRNVQGCTQDDVCGYCGMGCVRGAKCSTLKTCLPRAVHAGARVAAGFDVQRVLIESGRAIGVSGVCQGFPVSVRARKVVIAAGAVGTPALLLRSGVHGEVGKHLRLHPVTVAWGTFDEPVRPWTGTLQARYSEHLANLHEGYGVRFETAPIHPGFMALGMPWESATEYDSLVRRLASTSIVGVLARDRSEGRVLLNRRGATVVRYRPNRYDQQHIRQGIIAAAQVLAAAGARDVFATQYRYIPWRPASDPISSWVDQIDRIGYGSNQTLYVSFHQMGSARMGRDPRTSVVDGEGQAYQVRDLYVADGSLFPTASGVNPMVTIAALAYHVAQCLEAAL